MGGLFSAAAVWTSLLPALVVLALTLDLVRRASWGLTRFVAIVTVYLWCECAGVLATVWLWLTPGDVIRRNFALQRWWAGTLFAAGARIYALRVTLEGEDAVTPGPILLLVRHASVVDTLIPAVFVSGRTGLLLRYVLKRELLWDPCLDIVGQRLPNVFVRRGSQDPAQEIANVRALANDLGADEGVILFPEGTRYSSRRKADALARLQGSPLLARAEALTHTLPPRTGGTLALLDATPGVDVVICGHTGFDGALRLGDLWSGALVGRHVRVHFRRVPRAEIPTDRDARVDWLYAEWARLDRWVSEVTAATMR